MNGLESRVTALFSAMAARADPGEVATGNVPVYAVASGFVVTFDLGIRGVVADLGLASAGGAGAATFVFGDEFSMPDGRARSWHFGLCAFSPGATLLRPTSRRSPMAAYVSTSLACIGEGSDCGDIVADDVSAAGVVGRHDDAAGRRPCGSFVLIRPSAPRRPTPLPYDAYSLLQLPRF